jgi:phosphate-selective porin
MKRLFIALFALAMLAPALVEAQGCMEAKSEDGVNVMGYLQPQYEYNENNGDATSNFYFQRARIGVMGTIPYDFSYYALAEFSPKIGGPYLLDFFITWHRLGPLANITVGQFKQPFGLELSTPCQKLHTVRRSLVVDEMASPFRDLGVMVYGGTPLFDKEHNVLDWKLALTNGTGANALDINKDKTITARLVVSPLDFLHIGGSFKTGKVLKDTQSDDDKLTRFGADISVEKFNFLFQGEYIGGSDDGFEISGGGCGEPIQIVPYSGEIKKNGFATMLLYKTPWNVEPVVKYESYDANTDMDNNLKSSTTLGLNYFFNEWTRLQLNYVINDFAGVDKANNAFYAQLQVIF